MAFLKKIFSGIFLLVSLTIWLFFAKEISAEEIKTVNFAIIEDTYAESSYSGVAPWNNRNFYIGYDTLYDKGKTRAYLKYDFMSVKSFFDESKEIQSVTLKIFQYLTEGGEDYSVVLYKPEQLWNEYNLTWGNQPGVKYISKTNWTRDTGWKSLDIKSILEEDLLAGNSYGLGIFHENEDLSGNIFWSTACATAPSPPICQNGEQPYLTVSYTDIIENLPPSEPILTFPVDGYSTNSTSINFMWETSIDPENNPLSYKLKIAKLEDNSTVFESDWLNETSLSVSLHISDNFQWSVTVFDGVNYSNSLKQNFLIDNIAPEIVDLDPLAPFYDSHDLKLTWQPKEFSIKYQIEYNEMLFETNEMYFYFKDLTEGKNCFRIRAIDTLQNISEWSTFSCTIQDYTYPKFNALSIENPYISPYTSPGIKDIAKITYSVNEENIESLELFINDKFNNLFEKFILNSNSGEFLFPCFDINCQYKFNSNLIDGTYFVYLLATDKSGKVSRSNILEIYIDNYFPMKPVIEIMDFREIFNQIPINIRILTENKTDSSLFLNNNELLNWRESPIQNLQIRNSIKEGQNILKVTSTNYHGTSINSENLFNYDSIPPVKPILELIKSASSLYAKVSCADCTRIFFYTKAGLYKSSNMTTTQILLDSKLIGDTEYYFYVIGEDKAGNRSIASDPKSVFHSASNPTSVMVSPSQQQKTSLKSSCKYKFNTSTNDLNKISCYFNAPKIINYNNYKLHEDDYLFEVNLFGDETIELVIDEYICEKKSLWNIKSWFGCSEKYTKTSTYLVKSTGLVYLNLGKESFYPSLTSSKKDGSQNLKYNLKKDYSGNYFNLHSSIFFTHKLNNETIIKMISNSKTSTSQKVPTAVILSTDSGNKPFRFPFSGYIGVTQWHGDTKYQKPHRGIDFGANKEKIYAMADGYIERVGWEKSSDKCKNGGIVLMIKHDNGYYSLYAHLQDYKKANGKTWKAGERVLRGEQIGTTGNTGLYNCKALGFHLHLETRTKAAWKTDVNPVPLIDVNWDKIPTLNVKNNPGRLSGENPHPTF